MVGLLSRPESYEQLCCRDDRTLSSMYDLDAAVGIIQLLKLEAKVLIRLPVKHAENNVFQVGSSGINVAIAILAQLFQAAGESEYVRNGDISWVGADWRSIPRSSHF